MVTAWLSLELALLPALPCTVYAPSALALNLNSQRDGMWRWSFGSGCVRHATLLGGTGLATL